ncbi:hypothetical protein PILCRDRAFT_607277 [Piloderma croceum F 1598]|uniref:Uncharacterized protein n=1 Tax=Piloderma croceum (strain F 1598) TaxID=765440 RepID=A0A0C3EZK7_PILCF|nr:hypothetical protein PILCRDRAFT_607277 [Piloderma croceum F 1598]
MFMSVTVCASKTTRAVRAQHITDGRFSFWALKSTARLGLKHGDCCKYKNSFGPNYSTSYSLFDQIIQSTLIDLGTYMFRTDNVRFGCSVYQCKRSS